MWGGAEGTHEVNIHKDVYRLHTDTIEVAKINKLLLAMVEGIVHTFKGQSLKDINVSGKTQR